MSRRTLSGEFQIVNHHLLRDLTELGLWDANMRNKIIAHNGSIQVRAMHWPLAHTGQRLAP